MISHVDLISIKVPMIHHIEVEAFAVGNSFDYIETVYYY